MSNGTGSAPSTPPDAGTAPATGPDPDLEGLGPLSIPDAESDTPPDDARDPGTPPSGSDGGKPDGSKPGEPAPPAEEPKPEASQPPAGSAEAPKPDGEPAKPDAEPTTVEGWREHYQGLRTNYERLERRFQTTSEENARLKRQMEDRKTAHELWDYLAVRPELAQKVQQLIREGGAADPEALLRIQRAEIEAEQTRERELRAAEDELRTDPAKSPHLAAARKWLQDEGLSIQTADELKYGVLAYLGSQLPALLQQAEERGRKAALERREQAQQATTLQPGGPTGAPQTEPDWEKMDDLEALQSLGYKSLTVPD